MRSEQHSDKLTDYDDWRAGMNAFRKDTREQMLMLMERIKWLENPPKAPHTPVEREMKL